MKLRRRKRDVGGEEFRVETRGRETIAYWEGDHAYLFDAAWGVRPLTLYVPDEEMWDEVVPEWLKGRRAVVVDRLAKRSRHRVIGTDEGYALGKGELRPIASATEAYEIVAGFLDGAPGLVGPWTKESFEETDSGWRLTFRRLEPERYSPALPSGRGTLLVRRDTGEIDVE